MLRLVASVQAHRRGAKVANEFLEVVLLPIARDYTVDLKNPLIYRPLVSSKNEPALAVEQILRAACPVIVLQVARTGDTELFLGVFIPDGDCMALHDF